MAGIMKKIMPVSKSMSGTEFFDYNTDISIAMEYTGSPITTSMILKVLPVDIDSIPTAKIAASPANLYNLSLPVVEPIRKNIRGFNEVKLGSRVDNSKIQVISSKDRFNDDVSYNGLMGNGELEDGVESSGTLGFSGSSQDHSHGMSKSSDMLETPIDDCNEIEGSEDCMGSERWNNNNSIEPDSTTSQRFGGIFCEEEEASDGERLECRRKKKGGVTFGDHESNVVVVEESSMYTEESYSVWDAERPVPEKPPKKGMCYHCHRGNRFTEKEACLVCDAKYCCHCIRKAMGSMPQGRKCLTCIGYPIDDSKRKMLGKSSRFLRGWLKKEEVRQIMEAELSCPVNQLSPKCISVNGRSLCLNELMLLLRCPNPPRNLKPGSYWYDRVSGFWGKEGDKPCQIITPNLAVGHRRMMRKASNGNTNVLINGREITYAEQLMLKSSGIMCEGCFDLWLSADGTIVELGMRVEKGNIWARKRTKLYCAFLSLPTPESPNSRGILNHADEGAFSNYLEQRVLCKLLLFGLNCSGTSAIFKQARVLYDVPFLDEERKKIKSMIQSNLYGYLGRLLEGREIFEEECLLELRKRQSADPGPSDSISEQKCTTEYTFGLKLKKFSDWLIDVMVSNNLDLVFPASTREYAPCVEELWNDAAFQATYRRRDELDLPRVANYFLDRAVEIAQKDYEPSDTDIIYAEGITSSNGLTSMEFSFPQPPDNGCEDPAGQPADLITRYELIRVPAKSLGKNCKWLEMFEDVNIVLFCVSLIDYDEYEVDSSGKLTNKMLLSKRLFESIISHPTYKDMNFLLILNKFDLLEEKIEQVPLTQCEWFQDFNPVFSRHQSTRRSGNNVAPLAQRACHYIGAQFKRLFKSLTGRKLYVCPVAALEPDNVDNALKYAREILRWEDDKLNFSSIHDISSESIENSSYSNFAEGEHQM
ncbi:extra-large guanine nucleotide-binding protein 1-like [Chenopodium quinoa]|uniref:Extra-large guanine nucleotide-binding protein 1-like n=1 Tax=Chenopodium quinoa TaxID=63459 RepID=A0A803LNY4_CHEQI|nr:extra-large guanine nucleotide-binding protein 1-like [Chenopodium quinoa]